MRRSSLCTRATVGRGSALREVGWDLLCWRRSSSAHTVHTGSNHGRHAALHCWRRLEEEGRIAVNPKRRRSGNCAAASGETDDASGEQSRLARSVRSNVRVQRVCGERAMAGAYGDDGTLHARVRYGQRERYRNMEREGHKETQVHTHAREASGRRGENPQGTAVNCSRGYVPTEPARAAI